jgi:hypothetical protein
MLRDAEVERVVDLTIRVGEVDVTLQIVAPSATRSAYLERDAECGRLERLTNRTGTKPRNRETTKGKPLVR